VLGEHLDGIWIQSHMSALVGFGVFLFGFGSILCDAAA
jgi:hypothetical protein